VTPTDDVKDEMPSTITQPIAARVPNAIADELRRRAQDAGLTMSGLVGECVQRALAQEHEQHLSHEHHDR
jgi:hypothetical protein